MNPLTSPFQSAIYKPNKPAKPAMPVGGKYVGASSPVPSQGIMSQARHYAGMDPSPTPQSPGLLESIGPGMVLREQERRSQSLATQSPGLVEALGGMAQGLGQRIASMPAPQSPGLVEALGGMARGLGQRIASMPASTRPQAPEPSIQSPIPQERDMTQFMTPEVLARRNASIADRNRQATELAGVRERLGQTSDITGSNVQPGVDEDFLDRLRGSKLNGDALAQSELRNTGIGGVSRGGRYSGGDTAYSGSAFSEYDTPRPSTFSAERRDAAIAQMATDPEAMASRARLAANQEAGPSQLQRELFANNEQKYADRRQNALAMRAEQANQRQQAQAAAQQAYASNPLNNPVLADFVMNNPVAGAAIVNSVMNNQSEMQRANLEAGLRQAELGQRGTEFQSGLGLKQQELEANIQDKADNLALAKEADKRAGQTAESQATLNAAEAEYKKAQAEELKSKSATVSSLASPEAQAREGRAALVMPGVEAGTMSPEEADQFINGATSATNPEPQSVQTAARQLPTLESRVAPVFGEDVGGQDWGSLAESLLGRSGTKSDLSEADLKTAQEYFRARAKTDTEFDGATPLFSWRGPEALKARKDLYDILTGPDPITKADVDRLSKVR